MSSAKFGAGTAESWSEDAYANSGHYLGRRAELVRSLGPTLIAGDCVLDLACGDGAFAELLLPHGLAYLGVDASAAMVAAARARLGRRGEIALGTVNEYRPPASVAATTLFRALYYADNRPDFFRRAAEFTEKKLVFDLNPRQYRLSEIRAELATAGWIRLELRPFFVPQTVALPPPALAALSIAERCGPVARALLRFRFTYICAASRGCASRSRKKR